MAARVETIAPYDLELVSGKKATVRDRRLPGRSLWSNGFNRCRPRRWLRGLKPSLHTTSRRRARPQINGLGYGELKMELGIIGNIGVIGIINERSAHGLAEARGRDKNFSGSGKNKGLKVFKVNKVGL